MTKQLQVFVHTLLIGVLTLGANAQFTATAQTVTMTTNKAIGDKIRLTIIAEGEINIDGATGTFINGAPAGYTLTKQTVSIKGKVTMLDCGGNQLTNLDLSKNANLDFLVCWNNKLTRLDISKNTALTVLFCDNNKLANLDVSKNIALTSIYCGDNQLTNLDLSKNTALTRLNCDRNPITSLDLSKNTALSSLNCAFNQFTNLDVSRNTALTELGCAANPIKSLDVSKNTALTSLYCWDNQLTSLDLSTNTALTKLYCDRNQLTNLDLSTNTALNSLNCFSNQIKDEAMIRLVKSLPTCKGGKFCVIDTKNPKEGNICTKDDVTAAKTKGWQVLDLNGKWDDRKDYEGSESNSVAAVNSSSIQIYPNPATDFVQIQGTKASAIVRIYSLDGRLVLSSMTDVEGTVRLDVTILATGEYLIIVGGEYSKLIIE